MTSEVALHSGSPCYVAFDCVDVNDVYNLRVHDCVYWHHHEHPDVWKKRLIEHLDMC